MFFVAFDKGFVANSQVINNRRRLVATRDPREALSFLTYEEANDVMRKAPEEYRHYAILQTPVHA